MKVQKRPIMCGIGVAASATLALGVFPGAAFAARVEQPSASVAGNTLSIVGTSGGDDLAVRIAAADPSRALVDFNNGTLPLAFDLSSFRAVDVHLGGGDDRFVAVQSDALFTTPITVDGGAGNDIITGGSGDDTLSGGAGDDQILGSGGNDVILGNGGDDFVDGQIGTDTELLGAGQDTANWNPGEGSDSIDGGAGYDRLTFNGSNANENIALSAVGGRAVLTRDVAAIRMDMDGVEQLDLTTLGGADTVTLNDLTGSDLRVANVDLAAITGQGDGSLDNVVVNGSNKADNVDVSADASAVDVDGLHTSVHLAGGETQDALTLHTLGGNDTVTVSDEANALIGVTVDLGIGQVI
jgi:RTX calcium-binding nonapeptide repeat (4 copies)